jgi:starch synthase
MKLLIASAELEPVVTTGGLGNAVSGLARALTRRGHDVTVAIPGYQMLGSLGHPDESWGPLPDPELEVAVWRDDDAFDRPGVYGPTPGSGYGDNWWRFGRFALAVAQLAQGYDLVHLHDAHAAAAALLVDVPVVYTIHNASHHLTGPYGDVVELLGLAGDDPEVTARLEWYGGANYLKAGFAADRVTTVSPSYAAELAVEETSHGLAGVVGSLAHPVIGILNGIDEISWDPQKDAALPVPFSADDLTGRAAARAELLDRCELEDGVIFGNVGRMARQKGLDLLAPILHHLVDEGMRLVLVGRGELDVLVDGWVDTHPGKVAHLEYDEGLARLVSAGSDAYLMPSEFEPCGLGQMYSMRYGAPPVAHLTGGLADSVIDADEDPIHANGFGFRSYDSPTVAATIERAMDTYQRHPERWLALQMNGMHADWSWSARAAEYEAVFDAVAG